jgi:hypothetical protein
MFMAANRKTNGAFQLMQISFMDRGGDVGGFDAPDDQGNGGLGEAKACRNCSGELAG